LLTQKLDEEVEISSSPQELASYLKGTEGLNRLKGKTRNLLAAIKVTNEEQISTILKLANQLVQEGEDSFSIYPISSGNNWGYGTSQPASLNQNIVLLDLSSLNKILGFEEELGLITIQPGVTQRQLADYLIENEHDYMVPVTGAGPDCSILANALERGYGITPYTDHFAAVNSIQGYWADGTPFMSAVQCLDGSIEKVVDKTYKWGLGPYIDGLFTQSNLGVTTRMTVRLAKRKKAFCSFFIKVNDDKYLEQIVPRIRKVLQDFEGIVGSINLMDKRRVLSMFATNPQGYDKHKTMTDEQVARIAKSQGTTDWTVVGSIYGNDAVVKAVKKEIKTIFKEIPAAFVFSDSLLIAFAKWLFKHLPNFLFKLIPFLKLIKEQLASFDKGEEIMQGHPNKVALKLAYWRNPNIGKIKPENYDPSDDNCGLLWYAPLVPMKSAKMRELVEMVRNTCPKYNIEPFITFTNLKHDCVDSTIPIVFHLDNEQAVKDAHNCVKELVEKGLEKGFVPYRLNIQQQQELLDKDNMFWSKVTVIKKALDPNNIISPSRYNP